MAEHKDLLEDLDRTLGLIGEQRYFQTDDVLKQVTKFYGISKELDDFLQRLGQAKKRRVASQYLRALKRGRQDDKALAGILGRLDRVKLGLMARIHIIHVGMTATIPDGLQVKGVQPVEEKETARSPSVAAGTCIRDDGRFDSPTQQTPQRSRYEAPSKETGLFIGSLTFNRATVIYGDVGVPASRELGQELTSEYRNCEGWDDGRGCYLGTQAGRKWRTEGREGNARTQSHGLEPIHG